MIKHRSFKVLQLIATTIESLGFIFLGVSIGIPIILVILGDTEDFYVKAGLGLLVAFFSLLIIGAGQVIKVFLQIEENTRIENS